MWNIININKCERKSEIESASTIFRTTIRENYKGGRKCVKSEKIVDLLVMWVDARESMIQDEGDELVK